MKSNQEFEETNSSDATSNLSLPLFHKDQIPLAFLKTGKPRDSSIIMAADVGGTKTNLALFQIKDGALMLLTEKSYATKTHKSFWKWFIISKPAISHP